MSNTYPESKDIERKIFFPLALKVLAIIAILICIVINVILFITPKPEYSLKFRFPNLDKFSCNGKFTELNQVNSFSVNFDDNSANTDNSLNDSTFLVSTYKHGSYTFGFNMAQKRKTMVYWQQLIDGEQKLIAATLLDLGGNNLSPDNFSIKLYKPDNKDIFVSVKCDLENPYTPEIVNDGNSGGL